MKIILVKLAVAALAMLLPFQSMSAQGEFSAVREWVRMQRSLRPKNGVVGDEKTCLLIAEPILRHVFGDKLIEKELPLRAELKGDVWTVIGTFHGKAFGGTAVLQLKNGNAQVVFIHHEE